ncbi:MAG: hypothetical protein ABIG71_04015 [Candidatus Uhrbacteria bacterium]
MMLNRDSCIWYALLGLVVAFCTASFFAWLPLVGAIAPLSLFVAILLVLGAETRLWLTYIVSAGFFFGMFTGASGYGLAALLVGGLIMLPSSWRQWNSPALSFFHVVCIVLLFTFVERLLFPLLTIDVGGIAFMHIATQTIVASVLNIALAALIWTKSSPHGH